MKRKYLILPIRRHISNKYTFWIRLITIFFRNYSNKPVFWASIELCYIFTFNECLTNVLVIYSMSVSGCNAQKCPSSARIFYLMVCRHQWILAKDLDFSLGSSSSVQYVYDYAQFNKLSEKPPRTETSLSSIFCGDN